MSDFPALNASGAVQNIATQVDSGGNVVAYTALAVVSGGVASVSTRANPLPVSSVSGPTAAIDGSGTVSGSAINLFSGTPPPTGFLIQNNSTQPMWFSDITTAVAASPSIQVAPLGGIFVSPPGYKAAAQISLIGTATGQPFSARSW